MKNLGANEFLKKVEKDFKQKTEYYKKEEKKKRKAQKELFKLKEEEASLYSDI